MVSSHYMGRPDTKGVMADKEDTVEWDRMEMMVSSKGRGHRGVESAGYMVCTEAMAPHHQAVSYRAPKG